MTSNTTTLSNGFASPTAPSILSASATTTSSISSSSFPSTSSSSARSTKPSPPPTPPAPAVGSAVQNTYTYRLYTPEEVAQHSSTSSMWVIIHGKVYDVHAFMEDHPGGPEILSQHAGKDATQEFEETFHSPAARGQLKDYLIGGVTGYAGPDDAHLGQHKPRAQAQASGANKSASFNPVILAAVVVALGIITYLALPHLRG